MSEGYRDFAKAELAGGVKVRIGLLRQTTGIADNFAVSKDMPGMLFIKASAARDVLLPRVTADVDGRLIRFYNEGTGVITFKTSSDAALVPARTLAGNCAATFCAINGLAQTAAWKLVGKAS